MDGRKSPASPAMDVSGWKMHGGEAAPVFAEFLQFCAKAGFEEVVDPSHKDINKDDCLVIVDMQGDFIPKDHMNEKGGRLASTEGGDVAPLIVKLAEKFGEAGGVVVATRDYHPIDHCSFLDQGGQCPPHCVQGSAGSHFYEPIGKVLEKLMKEKKRVDIVFKGYHQDVESFGSFRYGEVPPADRGTEFAFRGGEDGMESRMFGCKASVEWTGSDCLRCSNCGFEDVFDVNSPPDVLSVKTREPLAERLVKHGVKRVFVCGLVTDLCVIDTALNATKAGFSDSFLILDASRPCHVPGLGQIGTGFLNPQEAMKERIAKAGVKVVPTVALLPDLKIANPQTSGTLKKALFPHALGPFQMVPAPVDLRFDNAKGVYEVGPATKPATLLQTLKSHGVGLDGTYSPRAQLTLPKETRAAMKLPDSAVWFQWCNPLSKMAAMPGHARSWFTTNSASAAFLMYGGFVYLDKDDKLVASMTINVGKVGLVLGAPQPFDSKYSKALARRWCPVTIPNLQKSGAKKFCWINPGEVLEVAGLEAWEIAAPHGAFAYLYNDDLEVADERNTFFPAVRQ